MEMGNSSIEHCKSEARSWPMQRGRVLSWRKKCCTLRNFSAFSGIVHVHKIEITLWFLNSFMDHRQWSNVHVISDRSVLFLSMSYHGALCTVLQYRCLHSTSRRCMQLLDWCVFNPIYSIISVQYDVGVQYQSNGLLYIVLLVGRDVLYCVPDQTLLSTSWCIHY